MQKFRTGRRHSLLWEPSLAKSQKSRKLLQSEENLAPNLSDTSPHGTLTSSETLKGSRMKPQTKITGFFNFNTTKAQEGQDRQEQLNTHLNAYSLNGLPSMPGLLTIGQRNYDDRLLELEGHWTDIVHVDGELTKRQKDQQEALWELLQTEVKYINNLKVIKDLFMCCLINLQNESLLNEIETEKVFGNIGELYEVNRTYWEDQLYSVVEKARNTHTFLDPSLLEGAFENFEEQFQPYTKYCLQQKQSLDYIRDKYKENELFKTFVVWAEAQKACKRLKLQDLIVTPMQRLTKYKLLLMAIHKKTEDDNQRRMLKRLIEKVDRFVVQVNTNLHQRAEHERLRQIIDRIDSYDAIDAPTEECMKLVSDYCKLDLTCPVPGCGPQQRRHQLLEGSLKLKDAYSRMDVYCFLFTDMLLVTKALKRGNNKVKVIKPPMRLDKIMIQGELRDPGCFMLVYLNEYHLASAVYTFHGEVKQWIDAIKKAQEAYRQMRKSALDRAENRPYYFEMYDDTEDDSAVFNVRPSDPNMLGVSDHQTIHRLDSTASVDMFLPTLDGQGDGDHRQRLSSSVSFDDFRDMERSRSQHNSVNDMPRSRSPRPKGGGRGESLEVISARDSSPLGHSPPGSPRSAHRYVPSQDYASQSHAQQAWGDNSQTAANGKTNSNSVFRLANRPDLIFVNDDSSRSKLNQRRVSRQERRYHTADAIQDMRKDRDTTIHKRLSWNYGTVDISIEEKQEALKHKAFSSDSLRSVPSSSGVSSTGSLHLSPESEICEEMEDEGGDLHHHQHHPVAHLLPQSQSEYTIRDSSMLADLDKLSVSAVEPSGEEEDPGLTFQTKSVSKSMPDISEVGTVRLGELQDGIASVELGRSDNKTKMSHAQILRMKKQLLLNCTIEASEV